MPEEKKENKATPNLAPSAGGKKKEAFTFSDKIKNSKQASSKSFANRASSRIGSDGKPRQTLFERTKRDAPFFIAALVALLLLPFLYKYSGNVNEEPTMVTPGGTDTIFDPDAMRSGFDFTGDPEQVVALQSGRDSIDLILGLKSKNEEESDSSSLDELYRSGFDDSSVATSASTEIGDEENNTTNIYRYRKGAKPATRAAFRRAATKLNRLGSAGAANRSGGRLGVGMWGGGLKTAAKKVRGETPQSAPKPVSLQPLQAAGKPSRSYFGNNAGAEARRSRDAMSKSNALQALNDAQMRPVDPGKIGGIFGGDFGGPGGGNGKLDRAFTFNGKEPWWWDLMKTRSQMEWEKKFNRKWNWIEWGDKLLQKLFDGILSCVLTGTDDWSMGRMFGAKEGSGKVDKCGKMKAADWKNCSECQKYGQEMTKAACYAMLKYYGQEGAKDPWTEGTPASSNLGFFGSRLDCLTNGIFDARKNRKAGEGVVKEQNDCNSFYLDGRYHASVGGKYTLFHYVVGVREQDLEKYNRENSADKRKEYLVVGYIGRGGDFAVDPNNLSQRINDKLFVPLFIESVAIQNKKLKKKCESDDDIYCVQDRKHTGVSNQAASGNASIEANDLEDMMAQLITPSGRNNSKAKASVLKYNDLLAKLRKGGIMVSNTNYKEDYSAEEVSTPILSAKGGKAGKGWVTGARCAYPLAFASCHNNGELLVTASGGETKAGMPAAFITVPNAVRIQDKINNQFMVVYRIQGEDNADATSITTQTSPEKSRAFFANAHASNTGYPNEAEIVNDGGLDYSKKEFKYTLAVTGRGKEMLEKMNASAANSERRAIVTWEIRQCYDPVTPWAGGRAIFDGACGRPAQQGGNGVVASSIPGTVVSSATCVYYDGDDAINPYIPICRDGEKQFNPNPKVEGQCQKVRVCQNDAWGAWQDNPDDPDCTQRCRDGEKQFDPDPKVAGQCQKIRVCQNGQWNAWQNNPDDPDCKTAPVPPSTVRFYPRVKKITDKPDILKPGPRPGKDEDGNPKWSDCKLTVDETLLLPKEQETKDYFKAAKAKFDNANKDAKVTLEYQEDQLTVANLVDAIMIDPGNGTVPANTVCLLGKTIGAAARDPQADTFDNLFGAFLAYMNNDSASFPSKKTYNKDGVPVTDRRFLPNSGYWWGGYVWKGDREPYEKQLKDSGIWTTFPLAELNRTPLEKQGNLMKNKDDEANRKKYHDEIYPDLMKRNPCTYQVGKKITQAKVLEYVDLLCKNGERTKPKAWHPYEAYGNPQHSNNTHHQQEHGQGNHPTTN